MIIITDNKESKKIDELLINEYNIPEMVLMENAARGFIEKIDTSCNKYIVVSGPGNNGADGLCIARLLKTMGKDVKLICPKNNSIHYNIAKNIGIPFITCTEECDILIDSIFGVGLSGEISDEYMKIIENVNKNRDKYKKIISVDLPTPHINPDFVVMLSSYKQEMLYNDIPCVVSDIGVPQGIYESVSNKYLVDEEYIKSIKKERNVFSNKGDFGKNLIYAKNGAALLSVAGSIKSGSGYTFLLSDANTKHANLISNPECINISDINEVESDVLAIGPALGDDDKIISIIKENIDKKMVLDADALNMLSKNEEIIEMLSENTIITPHPLEFARISKFELEEVLEYPFMCLNAFKRKFKGVILLKGKNTIITYKDKYYIINIGNSKMANAGMGDLLFGMISSYYAQGYSNIESTIYGAYLHAKYGSDLSKKHSVVNPSMILNKM